MNYSPGPWTCSASAVYDANGVMILKVPEASKANVRLKDVANVRLAAVATELFEAAVAVLEAGGFFRGDDPEGRIWCDLVKPLEAAVKKVRGW